MAKSKKILTRGSTYTRIYEDTRGVRMRGGAGTLSSLTNMYVDYEGGGVGIETVPGFRKITSCGAKINGLYRQKLGTGEEYILSHAGTSLGRIPVNREGPYESVTTLADAPSSSFTFGECLYVLDGKKIIELSPDGDSEKITAVAYVPTTYRGGEPYEERNLLTNLAYEEYDVDSAEQFAYGSPHLLYSITSYSSRECAVSGINRAATGKVYVPAYKYIGGVRYAVTEILPYALEGALYISELIIAEGVRKIGDNAVRNAASLLRVITPSSLESLGKYAFYGCSALNYIRLGIGLSSIGTAAFGGCSALTGVAYEGDSAQFTAISGYGVVGNKTMEYNATYTTVTAAFATHGSGFKAISVYVDEREVTFAESSNSSEVIVEFDYKSDLEGRCVRIYGCILVESGEQGERGADLVALYGKKIKPQEAILGCTVAEVFDGRIFLSGNPSLPNVVFYSSIDKEGKSSPHYFGSYDFFHVGVGSHPVSSMCSSRDSLIVFKSGDDGTGSIFYYAPRESGDPLLGNRYELSYSHKGAGGVLLSTVFVDRPVFLCQSGLSALEGGSSGGFRRMVCLSEAINPQLLSRGEGPTFAVVWRGYLFLSCRGRVFLADSRDSYSEGGEKVYRWYPLSGIGSHENATRVYVYAEEAPVGYVISDRVGEVAGGTVISVAGDDGKTVYYVKEEGNRVAVIPTEEYTGGTFHPAAAAVSVDDRLYFGTENGDVFVFNNDKRGTPPDRIRLSGGFDAAEYERTMGGVIHPDFYDFAGHRIECSLTTAPDDCGEAGLKKCLVRGSTALRASSPAASVISYGAMTDGEPTGESLVPIGALDFSSLDFSCLSLTAIKTATLTPAEGVGNWARRSITIASGAFRSPFALLSLSYGYRTGGVLGNE